MKVEITLSVGKKENGGEWRLEWVEASISKYMVYSCSGFNEIFPTFSGT